MDVEAEARRVIRRHVWAGFYDAEQIIIIVSEEFYSLGAPEADWLRGEVEVEYGRKRSEEANWPAVTDCDRLDRAFEELEKQGIIALQDTGLTKSDGLEDVADEYEDAGGPQSGFEGYCFYHGQDLERVKETGRLYLAFGHFDGDSARSAAVGHCIREVLTHAGFTVEWNGEATTRLQIHGMTWRRRSPT